MFFFFVVLNVALKAFTASELAAISFFDNCAVVFLQSQNSRKQVNEHIHISEFSRSSN